MSESIANPPAPPEPDQIWKLSRSMMINVVIPLGLIVFAAVVVLILGSVQPEKRPEADTTRVGRLRALPPVRVSRLQSLDSTGQRLELEVDGTVVPYREARVAAEVAGRVVFKSDQCEAGSYVKEDQLLMKIDDTDYRLEAQSLERQLEQETQSINEVDQEIRNTQRLIDVAEKDVDLQQKEVDRLNSLPAGFASRAEIDQANRALLAATQQLVTVENQYDLLQQRRLRMLASKRLASTQLEAANVNVDRTEIRAPIEGVIVNEDADLNTFVARGNTLVTIEDTSKVEVSTSLRMDQLYWVLDQKGGIIDESARGYDLPETPAMIEYELTGREDLVYRWKGRLLSYDGIGLDSVTRTVPVRVVVDNPTQYIDADGEVIEVTGAPALVRGMYVRVKLLIQPKTDLVVIPARALQPGNRVWQFVPDDSVLDLTTREVSKDDAAVTDQKAASKRETDSSAIAADDGGSFNPTRWEPGRVLVRKAVNPVDALRVRETKSRGDVPTDLTRSSRMWVCEVQGAALSGGSYVVVSPLGSVDEGKGIPVRADREGMNAIDSDNQAWQTNLPAGQSAATTESGVAEDT